MRKLELNFKKDNELNYLDLIILLCSNDLDLWYFVFRNEIQISFTKFRHLEKKLYNPLKSSHESKSKTWKENFLKTQKK